MTNHKLSTASSSNTKHGNVPDIELDIEGLDLNTKKSRETAKITEEKERESVATVDGKDEAQKNDFSSHWACKSKQEEKSRCENGKAKLT